MAYAIGHNDELWRECAAWLTRLDVLRRDHRANGPAACIADLANILRDGVLLCSLLNKLDPGCIDFKDVNQKPQLAQFLCLRNIQIFLRTCKETFGIKESELFEALMLFDLTNFHKVLCTLAKLSSCPKALRSNINGFAVQKARSTSQEEIYQSLQTISSEGESRGAATSGVEHPWLQFTIKCQPEERENEVYENLCYVTLAGFTRSSNYSPYAYVDESVGQPTFEKRDYVIKELIDTETNYVDVLNKLKRNFMRPLKALLSPEDHSIIFCEITELSEIHSGFLSQLHMARAAENSTRLSDVFLKWRERFLIYGRYCSNLNAAQSTLQELCDKNELVRQEVNNCQEEDNHGKFKLRDVLSVPMQRILKYHLLLQKLIEETEHAHDEYKNLIRAKEAMVDVAIYINEAARDSEHLNILEDLQGRITDWVLSTKLCQYGRLIKDGELRIKRHDDQKIRNRYVFIFDKIMILCKQIKGDSFQYRDYLDLREYKIEDINNRAVLNKEARWSYQWVLAKPNMQIVYTLYARTIELKNVMIKALEAAADNIEPSTCRTSRMSHKFEMHTFDKPAPCNHCSKFLKGLIFQGYKCKSCEIAVHKECIAASGHCGAKNPDPTRTIEKQLWFAGTLERSSATEKLEKRVEGTYMVRIRPQAPITAIDRYALSLKTSDTVKHMKICSKQENSRELFYLSQTRYFNSIIDLVNNYQTMSLRENFEKLDENVKLKYPYKQILCSVLRDVQPSENNQLSLRRGCQVLVIDKYDHQDGFWKGKINDQVGYFPSDCVQQEKEITYDLVF